MKTLLSGIAFTALIALILPTAAQATPAPASPQPFSHGNVAGTGGNSEPGTRGMAGNKSGITVGPHDGTKSATSAKPHDSGDESGVHGIAGNKSGKTVNPPQ